MHRCAAEFMAEPAQVIIDPTYSAMSKTDPASVTVLAELKAATGYNRRGVIEKAGWATPLGADKPNTQLAANCEIELGKAVWSTTVGGRQKGKGEARSNREIRKPKRDKSVVKAPASEGTLVRPAGSTLAFRKKK